MSDVIENARIVRLSLEARGDMLAFWLYLRYAGNEGQGVGGHNVRNNQRLGGAIHDLLRVVGVKTTAELDGAYVRVKHRGPHDRTSVAAIGHLLEDLWWDVDDALSQRAVEHSA